MMCCGCVINGVPATPELCTSRSSTSSLGFPQDDVVRVVNSQVQELPSSMADGTWGTQNSVLVSQLMLVETLLLLHVLVMYAGY